MQQMKAKLRQLPYISIQKILTGYRNMFLFHLKDAYSKKERFGWLKKKVKELLIFTQVEKIYIATMKASWELGFESWK